MSETAVWTVPGVDGRGERRRWRDAVTPVDRPSRRRWTCFYALLLLAAGALMATDGELVGLSDHAVSDAVPFIVVEMAIVFGMLRRGTRSLTAIDHPELDERDTAARDKAFRIAYTLLLVVLLATALVLAVVLPDLHRTVSTGDGFTEQQSGWFLKPEALVGLGIWGFLWAVFLPTGVLAWREPDALEPDPDEGAWLGRAELARDVALALALAAALAVALPGHGFWNAVIVLVVALSGLGALARRSARQTPVAGSTLGAAGLFLVLLTAGTVYARLLDHSMGFGQWTLALAVAATGSVLVLLGVRQT